MTNTTINNTAANNTTDGPCPFAPKAGYTTKAVYEEYFTNHIDTAPRLDVTNEYGLMANVENIDEPLFRGAMVLPKTSKGY